MMPKELIPEREKKLSTARNHNYSARMYTVYVGLNKTAEELGIKDYCIFLAGTSDSAEEYKNLLGGYKKNDFTIFLCSNIANPDASPKGTSVGFFTSMCGPDEWNRLKTEKYVKFKNLIAKKYIRMLKEQASIDIEPYIERAGIVAPSRCRAGECGWCCSKVISGDYFAPEENESRRYSDRVTDNIHPCVTFPLGDMVIEVPAEYV